MNRKCIYAWLAVVCFIPGYAAAAAYLCTDDEGSVSAQDQPCPTKDASSSNTPIRADNISDSNSIETVMRFYKAFVERDPEAAQKFLSDKFSFESIKIGEKTVPVEKEEFTRRLMRDLTAIKSYDANINCKVKSRETFEYILLCRLDERVSILKKSKGYISTETTSVIVENGELKISKIVSEPTTTSK